VFSTSLMSPRSSSSTRNKLRSVYGARAYVCVNIYLEYTRRYSSSVLFVVGYKPLSVVSIEFNARRIYLIHSKRRLFYTRVRDMLTFENPLQLYIYLYARARFVFRILDGGPTRYDYSKTAGTFIRQIRKVVESKTAQIFRLNTTERRL